MPFGIDCAVMPVSKAWFRLERGRQDAWSENMTIFLGSVLCNEKAFVARVLEEVDNDSVIVNCPDDGSAICLCR